MTRLSLRERRLVALLLLVAAVAGIWLVLIGPVIDGFTVRAAERDVLRQTYARDERAIAQIVQLRRQADRQRRDAGRFHYIAPGLAAAQLTLKENAVRAVVGAGGEMRSAQDLPAKLGAVRARLDCRVTLAQLLLVLERLGNAVPLLVIDGITIAADESFQTGHLGLLDVRLDIAADTAAKPR